MFPNKGPQGTFSGDSEVCLWDPLERCKAAAQAGHKAPGIRLIPADLLMLRCSWGVYLWKPSNAARACWMLLVIDGHRFFKEA